MDPSSSPSLTEESEQGRPGGLQALAGDLVRSGVASAVCVGAAARWGSRWVMGMAAAGRLGAAATESPVTTETFFDLASLTKPLTALAAARLARVGKLDFSAPLATWLPEVQGTPSAQVPLDLFLAHRAGV